MSLLAWILMPALGRIGGVLLVVVGSAATLSHEPWAVPAIAIGAAAWFAGSWMHTAKTSRYSSRLARVLFERTPLRWTLWQHWRRAMSTTSVVTTPQR